MNQEEATTDSTETTPPSLNSVSLQALADKLGTSPKRLRGFLREFFPRDVKKARWEISLAMAKKVERKFKTEVADRQAKKQEKLQKELEGQA